MKANETKLKLVSRFSELRSAIGADWKTQLAETDPFFNTKKGADDMARASASVREPHRIGLDHLTKVVEAMEGIATTQEATIN